MAVTYWEGDTDGDWMTDANWSGVHPAADDEVIFDGRCTSSNSEPDEGMLDSESGHVDHSTFDLMHFKPSYAQGLATAAEPCCCSPDKVIIQGSGTYHLLVGKTDQSTDTTIATTIIDNPNATVYLYSNCNDGTNLAAFTAVYVLAGTVIADWYSADTDNTGCYMQDLYMMPRNQSSGNVTVTMDKDAYDDLNNVATNIYMRTGKLICDSPIGTLHQQSGSVYYGSESSTGTAAQIGVAGGAEQLSITTLRQFGGTFNWYPDVDSGAPTITTAWLGGGSFLANATTSNDIAKTITTLHSFEGSVVNLANNKGNITVTNWYDYGATTTVDKGGKLALTYNQP